MVRRCVGALVVVVWLGGCMEPEPPPPAYPPPGPAPVAQPMPPPPPPPPEPAPPPAPPAPPAPAAEPPGPTTIAGWARGNVVAARDLRDWIRRHPQAAVRLFVWGARHPARVRLFVAWVVGEARAGVDGFVASHPGMPALNAILQEHRPAADAFFAWCRQHPKAAHALVHHPAILERLGASLERRPPQAKEPGLLDPFN